MHKSLAYLQEEWSIATAHNGTGAKLGIKVDYIHAGQNYDSKKCQPYISDEYFKYCRASCVVGLTWRLVGQSLKDYKRNKPDFLTPNVISKKK